MEAEEHHSLLSTNIALIIKLLEACTTAKCTTVQEPLQHTIKDPPPESDPSAVLPTTSDHLPPGNRTQNGSGAQEMTRLPKLSIPLFFGDILERKSFWDCFETAVHNNPPLSGVEKLKYLRAQLQGSAIRVITGLLLTNTSYGHLVTLLQDRYGQPHKLIKAHMKALIELPSTSSTLVSLQLFYDAVEPHTRSLALLGKPIDEFGSMLVTSILGNLPVETRRNLAKAHGSDEWTTNDLQHAILNEIRILEMWVGDNQ